LHADDGLWAVLEPLLPERAPQRIGRPRVDDRIAFKAVMFVLVTAGAPGTIVLEMGTTSPAARAQVGELLREWRRRRRLSQLELALEAGVSTRHLSFVETGRSRPSPELVLHLAEQLEVPLRERNRLLLAAGYAPVFEERSLDEPEMAPVRDTVQVVLEGHDPSPAIAVDHGWALVAHNRGRRC